MMPKPNPNKRNVHVNNKDVGSRSSEKILLETKPSFWLYSDNFILKIIVFFLLVFMFAPIMAFVYTLHGELVENFHIAVDNVMFYTEIILFLLILVVLIKIILDVLDWNYTNYVFTESHIVIQRGFIHKEKIIMSYHKIQDIEINQSIFERIIGVGDIIIYGANEMSETILDDIPSPKKAEEIILSRMNAIGFANQNTYQYQQNPYNPQNPYQQNPYNSPKVQQHPQMQQPNYNPQPNYTPQQNYQPTNQQDYQQNHQGDLINEDYIQPDHTQNGAPYFNNNYDEDVITSEQSYEPFEQNNQYQSSHEMDKDEIFRKHNQMFKRHNK